MEIIKYTLVSGAFTIYLVHTNIQETTLAKVSNAADLPNGMHFNVSNRFICAITCCKTTMITCRFFFSKAGHCQCLKEYGDYELWTVTIAKNYQERRLDSVVQGKQFFNGILLPVLHTYVGCYEDNATRHLPLLAMRDTVGLTTESCKQICYLVWNRTYFGTESGRECFCGDTIINGYDRRPDTECNIPCAGDKKTMCGGSWRLSLYKIV